MRAEFERLTTSGRDRFEYGAGRSDDFRSDPVTGKQGDGDRHVEVEK
jgi:hypothetical protein